MVERPIEQRIRAATPAVLTAALLMLSGPVGCATSDEGQPAAATGWSDMPLVPSAVALFKSVVSKPATRPVSSLHRLLFYVTDTTVDALNPNTLVVTNETPPLPLSRRGAMDLEAWERRLDAITGTTASRGTMEFLIDGDRFFPRLVGTIDRARRSVDVRVYIFDTDDVATDFADLLKRRAGTVDVRVLMDGLGTVVAGGVDPASLPAEVDQPVWIGHYLEGGSDVEARMQANPWLTGDHSKTFIIDRETAFVGGMNVGREYRYDWHDMMMDVRGPVVGQIARDFDKAWAHAGPFGDLGYLLASIRSERSAPGGFGYPIRVLRTRAGDSQIYRAQLEAIRSSQRYIYVETPYFTDNAVLGELIDARARGVDVRVILPTGGDSALMDRGNVVAANTMLESGIRVFLYPGFTHVKAAVYDGWACLGSANLDKLSLRVNEELNLATSHRATVAALEARLFEADFAVSTELTTPLPKDLSYRLAVFLADQF